MREEGLYPHNYRGMQWGSKLTCRLLSKLNLQTALIGVPLLNSCTTSVAPLVFCVLFGLQTEDVSNPVVLNVPE